MSTSYFAFFRYVHWPAFFISLALGILAIYVSDDPTRFLMIYPTPDNLEKVQYQDETGAVFNYEETQVDCPSDKAKIYRIPVQ